MAASMKAVPIPNLAYYLVRVVLSVVSALVFVCGHAGPRELAQVGAKVTARRLVRALVNDLAQGQ